MLASFFIKDGTIRILASIHHDGIMGDFSETVSPGEDFLGLPFEELIRRKQGSLEIDRDSKTARFIGGLDSPQR